MALSFTALDTIVAKFRKTSPNIAAAFDEVKVLLNRLDADRAALEARVAKLEQPTEPPPPPPPPPPPGGALLGLVPNGGFPGSYGAMAASLKPKAIREDHLSPELVSWAAANGAKVLGLGGPLTMGLVDQYPTINAWEYDNEPYFRGVVVADWARAARDFGKAFKAKYPGKTLVFPTLVQTNGGDYQTGGVWSPWVKQVFDAAPDIGLYYDGWSAHPYNGSGGPPDFTTLDKVKAQLDARGFTKPCYVTEIGWTVHADKGTTEANQALYLGQAVDQLRSRPWVAEIYWYCLRSWAGTSRETQFGVFRQDGTERPAAGVYRTKV